MFVAAEIIEAVNGIFSSEVFVDPELFSADPELFLERPILPDPPADTDLSSTLVTLACIISIGGGGAILHHFLTRE